MQPAIKILKYVCTQRFVSNNNNKKILISANVNNELVKVYKVTYEEQLRAHQVDDRCDEHAHVSQAKHEQQCVRDENGPYEERGLRQHRSLNHWVEKVKFVQLGKSLT